MSTKHEQHGRKPIKRKPPPVGTPICARCGHYAFWTKCAYIAEMQRGIEKARAVRYVAVEESGMVVCNKCWPEVRRLREWRAEQERRKAA